MVLNAQESVKPEAPRIHASGNLARPVEIYERGNVEKGFAEAAVVLEQTYQTSCEIHTPLEAHVSVARWEGGRLTIWGTTQAVFNEQQQVAMALGLPLSSVRVISQYVGGSFGSKAELSKHTLFAAIMARKTGGPVKLALSREESFLCVGNRPANTMTLKGGARSEGTLTALQMTNIGSVGAYSDWANVGGPVIGLYLCPNVRVEETETYTNAGKVRAFRGPGEVQCSWALEQMMDSLAEGIGMDPVLFRLKNIVGFSQSSGKPYTSMGLRACLTGGAKAFGWDQARARPREQGHIKRGVGVAACRWIVEGGPPTTVIVTLLSDGSVRLNMAAADQGTGTKTATAMIAAEELGVPLEKISIEHGDTGTTQYGKPGGGSHSLVVYGPAVRAAAAEVKRQLLEIASVEFQRPVDELIVRDGKIGPMGGPQGHVQISQLKGLAERKAIIGFGHPEPDPAGKLIASFAAQFAEVEVNTRSGEVRVLRLLGAHDSGRVIDRLIYENQVFGGMVMGIGFALTEKRVMDERQSGRMLNANWHDYKIPTAKDVPFVQACIPIDAPDKECNSVGIKGHGEVGAIPTAPAIANAIYYATGLRVTESPVSPMMLLRLLKAKRTG
ncbi:MAG TPA: molybdopterin cofactor-binding domain-containing protein [Blastocatellia bacterium]|nr:molybdopterin cofactor-binding domain-containing protein [Blastocatellia bacterium]